MSTLQHTYTNSSLRTRTRMALAVVVAGAIAAALMVALISSNRGSADPLSVPSASSGQPGQAQVERQLEAVAGPRYGVVRAQPAAPAVRTPKESPQRQLEAVAGPRYGQPAGIRERH
jgi:hypothetical protein